MKAVLKELPGERLIYFGDTARVPYGNKSAPTIIKFSLENAGFLFKFGVKFIIVACNTSSSLALSALRRRFAIPFLGVIQPAVKKAVQVSANGRIGIIATRATINSRRYQREIKQLKAGLKVFTQPCPLFVPLAEEGWTDDGIALNVARKYLRPLIKKNIDTLILGCTHYPLLKKVIRKASGRGIHFVDSAEEVAKEARRILASKGLLAGQRAKPARCRFYVSDEPVSFRRLGRRFLGKSIAYVQKV